MSFCLMVHDHDAPSGDFVHINPAVREIIEGTMPAGGKEGMNDFGKPGWGGPCPPSGRHQYEFHLYALNDLLEIPATSTKREVREEIQQHILTEVSLVGLYGKSPP